MFSFNSLRRFWARSAFVMLILSTVLFVGCPMEGGSGKKNSSNNPSNEDNSLVPAALRGTWVGIKMGVALENFEISNTKFTSITEAEGTASTYAGTIVDVRGDGSGAGYITIQYTTHTGDSNAIGKYYIIRYENLTASTMNISGAYKGTDPDFLPLGSKKGGGKTTQAEAESVYTVGNGYFGDNSPVNKIVSQAKSPEGLRGKWKSEEVDDEDYYYLEIRDDYITCHYDMGYGPSYIAYYFAAAIISVRPNYITLLYTANSTDGGTHTGKYGALHYSQSGGTTKMVVYSNDQVLWGNASEATTAAADALTLTSGYFGSDSYNIPLTFTKQP